MNIRQLRHPARLAGIFALALILGAAPITVAAPCCLDPSFDGDGRVLTDIGSLYDVPYSLAVDDAGRIVVAGQTETFGSQFAVVRYNPEGSLDRTFDGDGVATVRYLIYHSGGAVALDSAGRIVVAGSREAATMGPGWDFAVMRLNPDGSPDTSFGDNGKQVTDFGSDYDLANALVIDDTGRIVVAGQAPVYGSSGFGLARYNSDGSPDRSFGEDGKVATRFEGYGGQFTGVGIDSAGRIVATGWGCPWQGCSEDFVIVRYHADGTLDTGFGDDGLARIDFGATGGERAYSMAIDASDRILVVGETQTAAGFPVADFALTRLNPDGSLDASFGGDGKVTTDFAGQPDRANSVVLDSAGRIVVAGAASRPWGGRVFGLARYNPDGSLDTTFFGTGKTTTSFGGEDSANGVALDSAGRIVVAGESTHIAYSPDFAVARYLVDGACHQNYLPFVVR